MVERYFNSMDSLFRKMHAIRSWIKDLHPIVATLVRFLAIFLGLALVALGIVLIPLPGPGSLVIVSGLMVFGLAWEPLGIGIEDRFNALRSWWTQRRSRKRNFS